MNSSFLNSSFPTSQQLYPATSQSQFGNSQSQQQRTSGAAAAAATAQVVPATPEPLTRSKSRRSGGRSKTDSGQEVPGSLNYSSYSTPSPSDDTRRVPGTPRPYQMTKIPEEKEMVRGDQMVPAMPGQVANNVDKTTSLRLYSNCNVLLTTARAQEGRQTS